MNKSFLAAVLVLVVIVGAVGMFFVRSSRSSDTNNNPAMTNSQNAQSNADSKNEAKLTIVDIKNMMFTPSQVTIEKGSTVKWVNNDDTAHTITADNGKGPNSQTVEPSKSYEFTFNEAGSFQYHCNFHAAMHGTVVVK
jgi:plastocyanin